MKKLILALALVGLCAAPTFAGDKDKKAATPRRFKIGVSGMSCGACSAKVTKALEGVKGVSAVKVDLKTNSATVTVSDAKAKFDKAAANKIIKTSGFKLTSFAAIVPVTYQLKVSGMSCGACSAKVNKALKAMKGITVVEVSHDKGTATITADSKLDKKTQEAVKKAVSSSGFEVTKLAKAEAKKPAAKKPAKVG